MTKLMRLSTVALAFVLTVSLFSESVSFAGPITETMRVVGIKAPAEILVDRWGVPHIYAKSEADVFFLQGFNAARDRLFQIDLWRRRGLGQLSEVFGKAFVEQDKAARLFLYRGSMETPTACPGNSSNWTISPPNGHRRMWFASAPTGSRGI